MDCADLSSGDEPETMDSTEPSIRSSLLRRSSKKFILCLNEGASRNKACFARPDVYMGFTQ